MKQLSAPLCPVAWNLPAIEEGCCWPETVEQSPRKVCAEVNEGGRVGCAGVEVKSLPMQQLSAPLCPVAWNLPAIEEGCCWPETVEQSPRKVCAEVNEAGRVVSWIVNCTRPATKMGANTAPCATHAT